MYINWQICKSNNKFNFIISKVNINVANSVNFTSQIHSNAFRCILVILNIQNFPGALPLAPAGGFAPDPHLGLWEDLPFLLLGGKCPLEGKVKHSL